MARVSSTAVKPPVKTKTVKPTAAHFTAPVAKKAACSKDSDKVSYSSTASSSSSLVEERTEQKFKSAKSGSQAHQAAPTTIKKSGDRTTLKKGKDGSIKKSEQPQKYVPKRVSKDEKMVQLLQQIADAVSTVAAKYLAAVDVCFPNMVMTTDPQQQLYQQQNDEASTLLAPPAAQEAVADGVGFVANNGEAHYLQPFEQSKKGKLQLEEADAASQDFLDISTPFL